MVEGGRWVLLIIALLWAGFVLIGLLGSLIKVIRNRNVYSGKTKAKVLETKTTIEEYIDSDNINRTSKKTLIRYSYDVDGKEYKGIGTGKNKERTGNEVYIYYNPKYPEKSLTEEDYGMKGLILCGGVTVVFVLIFIIATSAVLINGWW